MAEPHDEDAMIEIGDPTEEPGVEESTPPPVVIEYHERGGVPWMLIPPMLALSAVGSILLYHKLAPRRDAVPPSGSVRSGQFPEPVVTSGSAPTAAPSSVEPIAPVEPKRDELKPVDPLPEAPAPPASTAEAPAEPIPPMPPPPAPKVSVEGLGFDPKALEADRNADARADPALAPAVRDERPEERDLPREVDPDLLPPDPRDARKRQEKRKLELARRVDEERLRFHAELKVICNKLRENSWSAILEMRQNYDLKIDPAAEKQAVYLLGKSGKFAGADRRTRIDLLRALGYPEPVILDNLFVTYEKRQIGERDGPKDLEDAYYRTALFLLRNLPRPSNPPARPVSDR